MIAIDESTGFVPLGAATPSAMKRFAIFVQGHLDSGLPIPRSEFCKYVAKRVCDPDDKQDFIGAVQGPRGSGKSYSCLYILGRISEEIARIKGGEPQDYFDPEKNVIALEDAANVSELLANTKKFQCILIDDGSVSIGNHDWNSRDSKNFVKIATTCRTRRWVIIVNAPRMKTLDNSFRDFVQVTISVVGSYHKGGFNLLKANFNQFSLTTGKTYHHKLKYFGHKIDIWAAFAPAADVVEKYDRVREESAIRLNTRIATTGNASPQKVYNKKSRSEINAENEIEKYGETLKKLVSETPDISVRQLSAELCLSGQNVQRMITQMGISIKQRPPGRPKIERGTND